MLLYTPQQSTVPCLCVCVCVCVCVCAFVRAGGVRVEVRCRGDLRRWRCMKNVYEELCTSQV